MDTYIPSGPEAGILGGKGDDGELDGIQAFKKGMKAKEQKDAAATEDTIADDRPNLHSTSDASLSSKAPEKPLDEIQLFKLMMQKEQSHKTPEKPQISKVAAVPIGPTLQDIENGIRKSTPSNGKF